MHRRACECSDPGCVCNGTCRNTATMTLYRVDMEDYTGTRFCPDCGSDAMETGLFATGR